YTTLFRSDHVERETGHRLALALTGRVSGAGPPEGQLGWLQTAFQTPRHLHAELVLSQLPSVEHCLRREGRPLHELGGTDASLLQGRHHTQDEGAQRLFVLRQHAQRENRGV